MALAAVLRPALVSPELLLTLRQAAPLGLAAIGQSLVMRGLSLDLSIGGIVVAVTYILTRSRHAFSAASISAAGAAGSRDLRSQPSR